MSTRVEIANNRIAQIESELEDAQQELKNARCNQKFRCACGALHRIVDCVAIEVEDYVGPYGCTGGDYYVYGELQVVCPNNETLRNRLLYHSTWQVYWDDRNTYEFSAEKQFNSMYLYSFKKRQRESRDERQQAPVDCVNNYYVDENRKKFGIHVKGIDK